MTTLGYRYYLSASLLIYYIDKLQIRSMDINVERIVGFVLLGTRIQKQTKELKIINSNYLEMCPNTLEI